MPGSRASGGHRSPWSSLSRSGLVFSHPCFPSTRSLSSPLLFPCSVVGLVLMAASSVLVFSFSLVANTHALYVPHLDTSFARIPPLKPRASEAAASVPAVEVLGLIAALLAALGVMVIAGVYVHRQRLTAEPEKPRFGVRLGLDGQGKLSGLEDTDAEPTKTNRLAAETPLVGPTPIFIPPRAHLEPVSLPRPSIKPGVARSPMHMPNPTARRRSRSQLGAHQGSVAPLRLLPPTPGRSQDPQPRQHSFVLPSKVPGSPSGISTSDTKDGRGSVRAPVPTPSASEHARRDAYLRKQLEKLAFLSEDPMSRRHSDADTDAASLVYSLLSAYPTDDAASIAHSDMSVGVLQFRRPSEVDTMSRGSGRINLPSPSLTVPHF
ncbi:unnamed protein product [Mycena citricolor]|uniref:Transmembrane protein n=1 Tax=Mycena citricolor TaxID=2018698 RepID=A0AAD2JVF2_9AGAR|nr:unnamed protein product [Mycena citricolor]